MIEAIKIISNKKGESWHFVMMQLKTANLITPQEIRDAENYFFSLEEANLR